MSSTPEPTSTATSGTTRLTQAALVAALETTRLVPVVVASGAEEGLNLAAALLRGHLPVAEVTLRLPGAVDAIAAIAEDFPEVVVGAGTVVRVEQVDEAVAAGAQFLVSPGLSEAVVERARELDVPIVPGVATPSDIMRAVALGIDVVKLFPAKTLGGPGAVKALAAPFPGLRFLPTGGIGADDLGDYLMIEQVVAVGGSWMVDRALVQGEDWDEVSRRSRAAVDLAERVIAARPQPHPADDAATGARA
ncbi:2-dehydro-3-deoxyphosphogluconate aldolase/(4S)-4-hydroxy-2-oxoglutarate aldolase [Sediminihabitans luteus]|uniref:2-dehydro-3-deoxyphosphogluconate aldolase/(4S)-4-hydroxy-2-oxoglutarate aldolase n=1 Tax=Sediminihabitans luteus TaxID=1138585 RepID=A0A2M9CYV3_9CELL|nr:bifunctional 4-hydroxy-2-oxoglutarate aldolase/2-dehydro-3-deoxy-phosphogluconate aldolase [Sediminihabitans luteus]PJJ77067.1 2-dehydro-3-deoxyphosphogluconate aldolase/(4S)-4-hydroxy-2-oxoglutarate aldolase [Sediminihabitans luteus]GIJ00414.1 2-dehydro-3-deoxy-phosphogluconate aldolase [Sediminihabitans luteus]